MVVKKSYLSSVGLVIVALLAGCDSAKISIPNSLTTQAIDGYIVGGDVSCDAQAAEPTIAGGWLSCPDGTSVISVVGGTDVGFDSTAIGGGYPFVGILQAPGDARYVTPLTSVATKMASVDGVFDRNQYDASVKAIGDSLGIVGLDLSKSPVSDLVLAHANTQLNLLATQFSTTTDDYDLTLQAVAELFIDNTTVDLTDSGGMVSAISEVLQTTAPHLALTPSAQVEVIAKIAPVVAAIETTSGVDQIDQVVELAPQAPVAFSIDKNAKLLSHYFFTPYSDEISDYSLSDFESNTVQLRNLDWYSEITFLSSAFSIARTLDGASVDVGIDIKSLSDDRRLSATVKGVLVSMDAGDSSSMEITMPQNSTLNARYKDINGVVTDVSEDASEDLIATSDNGSFTLNVHNIERELDKNGYDNFLGQEGEFSVTVVIDGVNFNVTGNGYSASPSVFTVETAVDTVTGFGLQGQITLTQDW